MDFLLPCSQGPPLQMAVPHKWSPLPEETSSKADSLKKNIVSYTVSHNRLVSWLYREVFGRRYIETLGFLSETYEIAVIIKLYLTDNNKDYLQLVPVYFTELLKPLDFKKIISKLS